MATKVLYIRVPETLLAEVRQIAADDDRTLNATVRILLEDAIKERKGETGNDDARDGSTADTARGLLV